MDDEAQYIAGRRAMAQYLIVVLLRELEPGPERNRICAEVEVAETREALRQLCVELGAEAPDLDHHAADMVNKYVAPAVLGHKL